MLFIIIVGTLSSLCLVKAARRWPGPLRSGRCGQNGRRVVCSVVTEDFRPELARVLVAAALRGVSATTVSGPHATRRRARVSQTACQRRRLRPVHPAFNHHSNFIHRH